MSRAFKLPDLGEGIHEGEIISVLVREGDRVREEQPIIEVETDKAAVEIPSPYSGVVESILVKSGDIVKVGDDLMVFSDLSASAETPRRPGEEPTPPSPRHEEPRSEVSLKETAGAEKSDTSIEREGAAVEGPVPASPATRRLARELGVDIRRVSGSGPAGLVTAEDVRGFAEKKEQPAEAAPSEKAPSRPFKEAAEPAAPVLESGKWGPVERTPLRSIRRATAKQMALSWSKIPHVSSQDVADITRLDRLRRQHKDELERLGGALTLTVFALKAATAALKKHPRFNASLDEEAQQIVLKRYYHLGVAVDTPDGLLVPVVRDVDRKSIAELAVELQGLTERARNRKLALEEMQGGTFTITNIGPLGATGFAPIINYPEAAILGLAKARWQPMVIGDGDDYTIEPRLMLPVMLSFDHRMLDGADAQRFIIEIIRAFEDPEEMLLMI